MLERSKLVLLCVCMCVRVCVCVCARAHIVWLDPGAYDLANSAAFISHLRLGRVAADLHISLLPCTSVLKVCILMLILRN